LKLCIIVMFYIVSKIRNIIYTEEFKNNRDAIKREKYFKSGAGRRKLKLIFEDYWRGA